VTGQVTGRLEPGSLFAGDYRIVRPLAEGGMGAVYVVEQLSTGKSRALKLMKPEIAQDAQSRQRFELEAKIGARIESDHIVEIQSAGVESGTPYIVMELLDGEDLRTRVERTGPMAPGDVREIFEQLCHAVAAAHGAGIIHRDLKPENVFLAKTKRAGDARLSVKVLDFGIAKLVAESATRGGTMGMIGTPLWMAPEQTELGNISPAADVWALGLMLYFMLTGQSYWLAAASDRATITQLLKEVVMGPLPPASVRARQQQAAGSIPPEVDAIFARCVVRDPTQRFPNAAQLWNALGSALAPPSARIVAVAGGPANANDQTVAGAPIAIAPSAAFAPSPHARTPAYPPHVHVPIIQPLAVDHGAGMSIAKDKRLWIIPIAIIAILGVQQVFWRLRQQSVQAEVERESETGQGSILPPPMAKTGPVVVVACRLCTTKITATGPVPQNAIADAIQRAVPMFDQQCLRASPRRGAVQAAGSVTYAFAVRSGLPANRRIERGSANASVDECLLRGLGDLTFPSSPDETEVSVAFAFDPRRPSN
jgi:eukaryotic-like serine/threonine-protein kinase